MVKKLFTIFLFGVGILHANFEKHLKKCPDKPILKSIAKVDYIYMINLDQRPEKYNLSLQQLAPYGITPYRFSAVNGWELSLETINDLGVKFASWMTRDQWGTCYPLKGDFTPQHEIVHEYGKNYFSHCMSRGAIGIVISHLSILQDALDSGYETIWVMEDDIECIRNPHQISQLIEELDSLVGKNGWDILFTDRDTKNQNGQYVPCTAFAWRPNFAPANPSKFGFRQVISSNISRIGARYGAYSMIVRKSAMIKLLNFFKTYQIFLPFDMEFTLPNDISLFTVNNDVVSTMIRASSDNGGPNYKKNTN